MAQAVGQITLQPRLAAEPSFDLGPIQNWQPPKPLNKWVRTLLPTVVDIASKLQRGPPSTVPLSQWKDIQGAIPLKALPVYPALNLCRAYLPS